MKKKLISGIVLIALAAAVTACGAEAPAPAETSAAAAVQTTTAEETTAAVTETSAETTAATETSAQTETSADETSAAEAEKHLSVPQYLESEVENGTICAEDNEDAILIRFDNTALAVTNDDEYPDLAKAVTGYMDKRNAYFTESKDSQIEGAQEQYSFSPDFFTGEYPGSYYLSFTVGVSQCDEKVFSFTDSEYGYSGGAHGGTYTTGVNFDSQTGKQLTISDICTDIPALVDILAAKLEADYSDAVDPSFTGSADYREVLTNAYGEDLSGYTDTLEDGTEFDRSGMNFVFTPDGIIFFTNQYDITDYASGTQDLTVLFCEAEGIFNEKYVSVGRDYVRKISPYMAYADLNGDGKGEYITSEPTHNDDWQTTGYVIKALGKEYTVETDPDKSDKYAAEAELEHKDGKFIYRLYDQDSEIICEIEL